MQRKQGAHAHLQCGLDARRRLVRLCSKGGVALAVGPGPAQRHLRGVRGGVGVSGTAAVVLCLSSLAAGPRHPPKSASSFQTAAREIKHAQHAPPGPCAHQTRPAPPWHRRRAPPPPRRPPAPRPTRPVGWLGGWVVWGWFRMGWQCALRASKRQPQRMPARTPPTRPPSLPPLQGGAHTQRTWRQASSTPTHLPHGCGCITWGGGGGPRTPALPAASSSALAT